MEPYYIVRDTNPDPWGRASVSTMTWSYQANGFVMISPTIASSFRFPVKEMALAAAKKYQKSKYTNVRLEIVECRVVSEVVGILEKQSK